jgi:hypothetical protein
LETSCKLLENRFVTMFQFVVWVLFVWSYFGGLGFPRSQTRGLNAWYPLGVYPNTQKSGHQGPVQRTDHWCQFPLHRWDDDDKRETVSNTKVSKGQTFSNKSLWRSCGLRFRYHGVLRKMVMGYG